MTRTPTEDGRRYGAAREGGGVTIVKDRDEWGTLEETFSQQWDQIGFLVGKKIQSSRNKLKKKISWILNPGSTSPYSKVLVKRFTSGPTTNDSISWWENIFLIIWQVNLNLITSYLASVILSIVFTWTKVLCRWVYVQYIQLRESRDRCRYFSKSLNYCCKNALNVYFAATKNW